MSLILSEGVALDRRTVLDRYFCLSSFVLNEAMTLGQKSPFVLKYSKGVFSKSFLF